MPEKTDPNSISFCIEKLNKYEHCIKHKLNHCNLKLKEFNKCIFLYLSS